MKITKLQNDRSTHSATNCARSRAQDSCLGLTSFLSFSGSCRDAVPWTGRSMVGRSEQHHRHRRLLRMSSYSDSARKHSEQRATTDILGDMIRFDAVACFQVADGAGHAQDPVLRAQSKRFSIAAVKKASASGLSGQNDQVFTHVGRRATARPPQVGAGLRYQYPFT